MLTLVVCCHICSVLYGFFFFFKQKTAYEMRISDWSSDVCSSDLKLDAKLKLEAHWLERAWQSARRCTRGGPRAPRRRRTADRWLPGGAAVAGRCRGIGLRLLCFLGPQALRAHRRRRAVERQARYVAAVAGRRLDDRPRDIREDDLRPRPHPLRSGNPRDHRGDRPRGGGRDRKSTRLNSRH